MSSTVIGFAPVDKSGGGVATGSETLPPPGMEEDRWLIVEFGELKATLRVFFLCLWYYGKISMKAKGTMSLSNIFSHLDTSALLPNFRLNWKYLPVQRCHLITPEH